MLDLIIRQYHLALSYEGIARRLVGVLRMNGPFRACAAVLAPFAAERMLARMPVSALEAMVARQDRSRIDGA